MEKEVENKSTQTSIESWKRMNEEELKNAIREAEQDEREEFDAESYIGKDAKITGWEVIKGQYGPSVLITANCTEDPEIRATKILGVKYLPEQKKFVWFKGSKTEIFMTRHKATKFDDLINQIVKMQTRPSADRKKLYLTFN